MSRKSRPQRDSALLSELVRVAVVHAVRGHQANAAVTMDSVVPTEEDLTVCTGILDRTEARREVWPIFHGFELGFGVRIVIRDVRGGYGFC